MSLYLGTLLLCCLYASLRADLLPNSLTPADLNLDASAVRIEKKDLDVPESDWSSHDVSSRHVREACNKAALIYRPIDGKCNNLAHPEWGSAFSGAKREAPQAYQDGANLPRTKAKSGKLLASPRTISRVVSPEKIALAQLSVISIAFGQMIAHDVVKFQGGTGDNCCAENLDPALLAENGGDCFPIKIDNREDFFVGQKCKSFVRDAETSNKKRPRQHINKLTSFFDLSTIYSASQAELAKLRGDNGRLRFIGDKLPSAGSEGCRGNTTEDYCFLAGHDGVNVWVGLGVLHTSLARHHNRIAKILFKNNPSWNSDKLFEEARKINIAVAQNIVYSEYLPSVLDELTIRKHKLKQGAYLYKESVNPQVSQELAVAAMRFGHSQIPELIFVGADVFPLESTFRRTSLIHHRFDETAEGLIFAPAESVDSFYSHAVTDRLFEISETAKDGDDLVSINIQRGRDHGVPPYNEVREVCGLPRISDFSSDELQANNKLERVYESVDDIDFYIGGVSEKPISGAIVGPTFACILGRFFHDIKYGDRYFYETQQPEGFSPEQLKEIKSIKLSSLLCATTNITNLQEDAIHVPDTDKNPLKPCSSFKQLDLSKWTQ